MPKLAALSFLLSVMICWSGPSAAAGVPMSDAEVRFWDRSITPDGQTLPPGEGAVAGGRIVYETTCASCHGLTGQGESPLVALVGGNGTLTATSPTKTVGSYWPYATTLFDYIRRAMPFGQQKSLSNDEVYAVTAYVLFLNGIIEEDRTITKATLPSIEMPNRDGFFWSAEARRLTRKR
jgi:cytochrome c